MITWRGRYGENFHLSARKIIYDNNGTIVPSKWLSKVKLIRVDLYSNTPRAVVFGMVANFTAEIRLQETENYEVYLTKITSTGDVNASLSIFMDAKNSFVLSKNHNFTEFYNFVFVFEMQSKLNNSAH